jgi:PUA domain protein
VKFRRYSLKSKESKRLLVKISKRLNFEPETFFGSKPKIEIVEFDAGKIYLIQEKPFFFQCKDLVNPTLLFSEFLDRLPQVVVDMGAVPYVCKGANIMVPGIVRLDTDFEEKKLVVIVDEKHSKDLALGLSLFSSAEIQDKKKGIVIKNIHFVSDKFWNLAKKLVQT